jgi:hypothetical protein
VRLERIALAAVPRQFGGTTLHGERGAWRRRRPFRNCLLIWHHRSGPYRGSWDPAPVLGSLARFKNPMARKILLKKACAVQNLFRTFAKLLMTPRFTSYHRFHLVPKGNRDELTN